MIHIVFFSIPCSRTIVNQFKALNYESEEIKSELVKLWTKLYQYEKEHEEIHFEVKTLNTRRWRAIDKNHLK